MKNSIFKNKSYIKWLTFAIWMVIWYLAAHLVGSDLILPGPHATLVALLGLVRTGGFWLNVLWTLLRTVLGIVISFAAGVIFAVLAFRSFQLREFLRLPVSFFKSIPVMAIIIYVIMVVKSDWVAVVVCFLMCFPIAYTNILNGLEALDKKNIELGASLGLGRGQMIRYILRPSLDPQIKTALSLITAMSGKVVVASEVLAIPKYSIGYQMLNSKYYLETADLFAYMIVLIVLSLLMEKLVALLTDLKPGRLERALEREAETAAEAPAPKTPVHVVFDKVSKSFIAEDGTESTALKDFSEDFGPGVTAVLAPSGAGKTTMARIITGLEVPDKGSVDLSIVVMPHGTPESSDAPFAGSSAGAGGEGSVRTAYLFQEDRLLPWLSVKGNMLLALAAENCTETDPDDAVRSMAAKLELADALGMLPDELSGGMAHRAALGRTLLYGGNVLILDEPFRGLDEELRGRIIDEISTELGPAGGARTVILITHDEDLAEELADRVIRI